MPDLARHMREAVDGIDADLRSYQNAYSESKQEFQAAERRRTYVHVRREGKIIYE